MTNLPTDSTVARRQVTAANGPTRDGTGERPDAKIQELVDGQFGASAPFWADIYEGKDVYAVIHQRRRATALAWIEELQLPVRSRILEVGCGAGLTAVELARRGFEVDATDTVPEMIELTRRHGEQANVGARLRPGLNDVHALDFEGEAFDSVVALGVIPWLHSPQTAIHEIARVLKPGGHLIVNADNAARLTDLVDPRYNPALRPLREALKRLLRRMGVRRSGHGAPSRRHSLRDFERLLSSARLQTVEGSTLGFGPFTFFGYRPLSARLELRLHHWLQLRAEQGMPGIRSVGAQYLVLARKAANEPS
jgi:2-polyprenyl-3-methyl-5-hydroxy-6-metoxy-1,4-benzoquinol methylase